MKKPWCINPFIQFSHTADGFYRACCVASVDRTSDLSIENMTPLEFFNSDYMKNIRKDMLTGEFSETTNEACRQCIKNSLNGLTTKRDHDNEKYGNHPKSIEAVEACLKDYNTDISEESIRYVNFKVLGNLCNLKCIMCGPTSSSKIAAERKKINPDEYQYISAELNPYTENSKEKYFNDLQKVINNVDKFVLVGGESMIHPDFKELFYMFVNSDNVANLELQITTNGTTLPEYVLENAEKFGKLHLGFSIDGVEDRGCYIRSDLKWKDFDTNLKRAVSSKADCGFGIAIQMLNIGYIDEIYDYLDSLGVAGNAYWKGLVTEPAHFRAINLPDAVKQSYLNKLSSHPVYTWDRTQHLIDILRKPQDNPESFRKGLQKLKFLDKIRNRNFLDHFSEFKPYL